jgi:glutaminase
VSLCNGDYDERTALHLAAAAGHYEVVKYLIDAKIPINPRDRWGATPLNDSKNKSICDLLLANGAEYGND